MTSETSIPRTQRAAVTFAHNKPIEVRRDWPVPAPSDLEPGQCLIRMLVSGVCHSDLHIRDGEWGEPKPLPLVGGHEGVGIIVAIAAGTPGNKYVHVGSRVGVKWTAGACEQCQMCRAGNEPVCPLVKASGYNIEGTFNEYTVGFVNHVIPIPDGVDSAEAAPILCAGVTVYRGLKVSGAKAGQWVAVPGAGGGLGHLAVQYASAMGLRVLAIDSGDEKRELCKMVGAEEWIDFKQSENIIEDIKAKCGDGLGPHVAVIVSPIGKAYEDAISYVRPSGTVIAIALPSSVKFERGLMPLIGRNVSIIGSSNGNFGDAIEALDFVARKRVRAHIRVRELEDLEDIYNDMRHGKLVGRVVVRIRD